MLQNRRNTESAIGAEDSWRRSYIGGRRWRPVDAAFKAIEKVVDSHADLQLYSVNAITQGTDSQGEVTVRLERGGNIVNGLGSDTDIVIASVKAYLHALNLLESSVGRSHPQHGGV